jgi:hypothetical protein
VREKRGKCAVDDPRRAPQPSPAPDNCTEGDAGAADTARARLRILHSARCRLVGRADGRACLVCLMWCALCVLCVCCVLLLCLYVLAAVRARGRATEWGTGTATEPVAQSTLDAPVTPNGLPPARVTARHKRTPSVPGRTACAPPPPLPKRTGGNVHTPLPPVFPCALHPSCRVRVSACACRVRRRRPRGVRCPFRFLSVRVPVGRWPPRASRFVRGQGRQQ